MKTTSLIYKRQYFELTDTSLQLISLLILKEGNFQDTTKCRILFDQLLNSAFLIMFSAYDQIFDKVAIECVSKLKDTLIQIKSDLMNKEYLGINQINHLMLDVKEKYSVDIDLREKFWGKGYEIKNLIEELEIYLDVLNSIK